MRVHRHFKTLLAVGSLATFAACGPYGHTSSAAEVSVGWDSGPLDRAYGREHADLEARHDQEIASPAAGESKYDRDHRQSAENASLELRYSQGKKTHSDTLPPA